MTKKLGRKNYTDFEQICPKQNPDFFLDCCRQRQFSKIVTTFVISHLIYKLIYSRKVVVKIESIVKIQFHRFRHYISRNKIYIFNRCIVHLPNNCALRSAQWSVDSCLNGLLWQIHNCSSALWPTRSRVWGSHDQAIFPPLSPINCQESCTSLSCLQNSYSLKRSWNNFCKLTVILTYTVL